MICPTCKNEIEAEHNSYENATMARHLRNEHGYSLPEAVALMRATAPTASDTHAELAALRDEVARLREAQANALAIIDEQAPALTGWRARELAERVRSALRGGDQICAECGMQHAPHANTLCSS